MLKLLLPITLLASTLCLGAQVKHYITLNDSVMIFNDGDHSKPCFKLFIKNEDNEVVRVIRTKKISIDRLGVYFLSKDLVKKHEKSCFAKRK